MILQSALVLISFAVPAGDAPSNPKAYEPELKRILDDYQEAERLWHSRSSPVRVPGDSAPQRTFTDRGLHPSQTFGPRFRAYIETHAGRPEEIDALYELLKATNRFRTSNPENLDAAWALERVIRDHAAGPEANILVGRFQSGAQQVPRDRVLALYEKVIATNPDRAIVARAKLEKGLELAALRGRTRSGFVPGDRQAEGEGLIRAVAREYADTLAGQSAARCVFELDHLQIGMPAPDLEGPDVDGHLIRLSDYRGRVVLVKFWGLARTTSGERSLPDRKLLDRFASQPFAIISISTDRDTVPLRDYLRKANVTWPHIHDGAQGGAIETRWNIRGGGDNFVIDQHGIIRNRNLDGRDLESAIAELVVRARSAPNP